MKQLVSSKEFRIKNIKWKREVNTERKQKRESLQLKIERHQMDIINDIKMLYSSTLFILCSDYLLFIKCKKFVCKEDELYNNTLE